MRKAGQGRYYGVWNIFVVACTPYEVDVVLKFKERACNGATTVIHVA